MTPSSSGCVRLTSCTTPIRFGNTPERSTPGTRGVGSTSTVQKGTISRYSRGPDLATWPTSSDPLLQHLAHLFEQELRGERLFEQHRLLTERRPEDGLRIARHKPDRSLGTEGLHAR